jgi:hypothetical protein
LQAFFATFLTAFLAAFLATFFLAIANTSIQRGSSADARSACRQDSGRTHALRTETIHRDARAATRPDPRDTSHESHPH